MVKLFEPAQQRSVTLRNRIVVSPMCMYSAIDGVPTGWHQVHLGSRAVGGAGLVFTEATAVEPEGRISPEDTGIWNEAQGEAWSRIARFIQEQGSLPGIQLAHAGRKASTLSPWKGGGPAAAAQGGWSPIWSSSVEPFKEGWQAPRALDEHGMERVRRAFRDAADRSLRAGFKVIELHAAHGYLIHQFLSPLVNRRSDAFGGSLPNRMRFPLEIVAAVRSAWPDDLPLWVRISGTDWVEGGWDLPQSIEFAQECRRLGADVIDCSSGGAISEAKIPFGPGYQVFLSEGIRSSAIIETAAVGLITEAEQAEAILEQGKADYIVMARELLRDPYWPRRAAKELGAEIYVPSQYARAW